MSTFFSYSFSNLDSILIFNFLISFIDRLKDTLKVSGAQVSPTEIEDCIRAHPDKLVVDVCVAGVSGGRTSDEKNPRAWIVLSDSGRQLGLEKTIGILDQWTRQNLSSYKWLRGGYELVDQVGVILQSFCCVLTWSLW